MVLEDIRTCPTYVINLDRRKDRWQEFQQQPFLREFRNLQRFSAVDGSKLDPYTDTRISPHTRINIIKNYRRSDYEINTLGAIGATLSHVSIWKKFLESDAEYVVVFEDDTLVREEDLATIDSLIPTLPSSWDMWVLGTHRWRLDGVPLTDDKKSWWRVTSFTGAHAYVLSRRGAKLLLEEPFPIETHVEYYIMSISLLKGLRVIKHPRLRMTYAMETKTENDSDTFESRASCPLCYMPDDYQHSLYFLPKHGHVAKFVQYSAFAAALYGLWMLSKRAKN